MARKLQLKRRAERQQATRQRIVEATVALHQSVGVAGTTISAIAELADVERLTVYRHFPDERSLWTACTGHYLAQNPPPDPAEWAAIDDRETRLRTGLAEIYAYHRRTERMILSTTRDVRELPVFRDVLTPFFAYWHQVHGVLAAAWVVKDQSPDVVEAAIGHAIAFTTWYSLVREQGLDEAQAIEVMVGMVRCGGRPAHGAP